MTVCKTIDTLSMAYLDDELADEERHELEAHLTECAQCRGHVEQERADRSLVRKSLAVGPAPDMLRMRVMTALDAEDRAEQKAQRRRWSTYLLPGSAMLAAAAAIAVFVGVQSSSTPSTPTANTPQVSRPRIASTRAMRPGANVSNAVARVTQKQFPLEVEGSSTGPWLRQNFAPSVQAPKFFDPGADMVGARLMPGFADGHDAAMVAYRVTLHGQPFVLTLLALDDVNPHDWDQGETVKVNNRVMHVLSADNGQQMVSYVDSSGIGYIFLAPEISTDELVRLVGRTDLVGEQ
jgi:mycothiol system anti-sigma-R factor